MRFCAKFKSRCRVLCNKAGGAVGTKLSDNFPQHGKKIYIGKNSFLEVIINRCYSYPRR